MPRGLGLDGPEALGLAPEKLKEARYAFSEQRSNSTTAPKVLAGLFKIIETLFGCQFAVTAPRWHPSVEFTALNATVNCRPVLPDQPARTRQTRRRLDGCARPLVLRRIPAKLQTPVAHLVCNFADGVDGKPALLTHDDVITLVP